MDPIKPTLSSDLGSAVSQARRDAGDAVGNASEFGFENSERGKGVGFRIRQQRSRYF